MHPFSISSPFTLPTRSPLLYLNLPHFFTYLFHPFSYPFFTHYLIPSLSIFLHLSHPFSCPLTYFLARFPYLPQPFLTLAYHFLNPSLHLLYSYCTPLYLSTKRNWEAFIPVPIFPRDSFKNR